MKAIGQSLIMAQCGMFVPASSFEYYPFEKMITRISEGDNLFKGESSFEIEMNEVKKILENSDKNTIVLGDEICKGTEEDSGRKIVAATLHRLNELGACYMFATHLSRLYDMKIVKNIKNLQHCHLTCEYDAENDNIIYHRKLKDGTGNRKYGKIVASAILQNQQFMGIIEDIENDEEGSILDCAKKSKYNSNIVKYKCSVCDIKKGEHLHVHHIKEQHTADENGMIGNYHKDSEHNLVVLCENCHINTHHGKLNIIGWKDTMQGRKLDYNYDCDERDENVCDENVCDENNVRDENVCDENVCDENDVEVESNINIVYLKTNSGKYHIKNNLLDILKPLCNSKAKQFYITNDDISVYHNIVCQKCVENYKL